MHSLQRQYLKLQQGFTLIEIMVVLIIIGIGAGMVSLSIGDATRPQQTKSTARQLYGAMSLALEDAVFLNKQLGLRFDFSGKEEEIAYSYQWLLYDPASKQWSPIMAEGFEEQLFPDFIDLAIEIEGQTIIVGGDRKNDALLTVEEDKDDTGEDSKKDKKKPLLYPDLYFLSSGEMQNFKILINDKSTPESQYIVAGNALGQMTFKRPDEDE
jgi:general secretion pathway protein H